MTYQLLLSQFGHDQDYGIEKCYMNKGHQYVAKTVG